MDDEHNNSNESDESNNSIYEIINQTPVDVVDTWEKFLNLLGSDLTNHAKDLVETFDKEMANVRANIRNLQRAQDCFREALEIIQNTFNTSILEIEHVEQSVDSMENHIMQLKKLLDDLEVSRNIFPKDDESSAQEMVEECRPFPSF